MNCGGQYSRDSTWPPSWQLVSQVANFSRRATSLLASWSPRMLETPLATQQPRCTLMTLPSWLDASTPRAPTSFPTCSPLTGRQGVYTYACYAVLIDPTHYKPLQRLHISFSTFIGTVLMSCLFMVGSTANLCLQPQERPILQWWVEAHYKKKLTGVSLDNPGCPDTDVRSQLMKTGGKWWFLGCPIDLLSR